MRLLFCVKTIEASRVGDVLAVMSANAALSGALELRFRDGETVLIEALVPLAIDLRTAQRITLDLTALPGVSGAALVSLDGESRLGSNGFARVGRRELATRGRNVADIARRAPTCPRRPILS